MDKTSWTHSMATLMRAKFLQLFFVNMAMDLGLYMKYNILDASNGRR